MRKLGFRFIYNISYQPDFNPIELYFAQLKRSFSSLRAMKLAGVLQDSQEGLIIKAVKSI